MKNCFCHLKNEWKKCKVTSLIFWSFAINKQHFFLLFHSKAETKNLFTHDKMASRTYLVMKMSVDSPEWSTVNEFSDYLVHSVNAYPRCAPYFVCTENKLPVARKYVGRLFIYLLKKILNFIYDLLYLHLAFMNSGTAPDQFVSWFSAKKKPKH